MMPIQVLKKKIMISLVFKYSDDMNPDDKNSDRVGMTSNANIGARSQFQVRLFITGSMKFHVSPLHSEESSA